MTECWNSVIVPFDSKRKIAVKKFYDSKGSPLSFLSGSIIIKKLIFNAKKTGFKEEIILTSNFLTYKDLDLETDTVLHEYSPIEVFSVKASYEVKLVEFQYPQTLRFCNVEEISFQLLNLERRKLNIDFSVHIYYKFC